MSIPGTPHPLQLRPLTEFRLSRGPDLLEKCRRFHAYAEQVRAAGIYDVQFRVELLSPLDHRITIRDRATGQPREMICFDSNSYLGLHLHPRVIEASRRAVEEAGIGTPSAQMLGGNNRWLRELEELVAGVHKRPECLVYPSGYQANIGILTALLRAGDRALIDRFSHASLHDGCTYSGADMTVFPHRDLAALDAALGEGEGAHTLVVTDGLFSMHGDLAPVPALLESCRRHGARLMVDDAHSLGILGPTGAGIEEHFGVEGEVDVLMGTFSKAPGAAGGYVCGDAVLIDYLRFFSHAAMFTASLPAPVCAGLTEAIRIMREDAGPRERLWTNTRRMWQGLHDAGLSVPPLSSPILTVQIGDEHRLPSLAVALYDAGIKAGVVQFPAVPQGESILRVTMNARHTEEEIDRTIDVLASVSRRLGIV